MENKKLTLEKTTITKLINLHAIKGGSCGTPPPDNTVTCDDPDPTVTQVPIPDLTDTGTP